MVAELKPAYTPIMPNNAVPVAAVVGREKWTFNDWSKNDPKGLAAMRENDKTTFDALINALPKELSNSYNPATDKKF